MRVRASPRGLASRLLTFGLFIAVVGGVWGFLNFIQGELLGIASTQANSTQAQTGIAYANQAWNLGPVLLILIGIIGLIAGAAFERGGP
jgi:hypothetical protein